MTLQNFPFIKYKHRMENFVVDKNNFLNFLFFRNVVLQAENEREKDEVML